MRNVTLAEAVELLDRAVAEKGADYIYPPAAIQTSCVYNEDGKPSCIVGHVFNYLGPEVFDFVTQWEAREGASTDAFNMSDSLYIAGLVDFDNDAQELLLHAQERQDSGLTWGYSVDYAKQGVGIVD